MVTLPDWLGPSSFSPHGFCLSWQPGLLAAHALSDAVIGLCYAAIGAIILLVGRRRPDMGPKAVFNALAVAFALCGLVHASDILVLWQPYYVDQAILKVVVAISSLVLLAVLVMLVPHVLRLPSRAQLGDVHARLTEAETAGAELATTMRRMRRVLDSLFAYVVLLDLDGMIQEINDAPLDRGGYRRDEVIGRFFADAPWWSYDSAVRSQLIEAIDAAKRGERRRYDVMIKVGTELIPIDFQISPLCDENGTIVGLLPTAVDISARKVAEVEVLKSEATLRSILDNSPYLTWLKDTEGRYLAVNKIFADFLRLDSVDQVKGKTDLDMQPKELADKYRADDAEVMASRQRKHVEETAFDGLRTFWIETFKTPIIDANGAVLGTVGFAGDITDRKNTEADLRIAAAAFESMEGIVITDASGVIVRVNRAFVETTGYEAEEVVGQTPRMLKSGRHDDAFYAEMWTKLKETGTWQGEIWDRRKNGEIYPKWLSISAVKAPDGTVTHYVGSHIDITERKAAEERIKDLGLYDPLTRLPNRRLMLERLQQALAVSIRTGHEGALLFVDLDNFKTLNDTLGHDQGDLLLVEVAQRLTACVRETDTVARLGGDEFVVVLESLAETQEEAVVRVEAIGEKIIATVGLPYRLAEHDYVTTPSIGITLFGDQRENIAELLKQADIAMYQAKTAGRNAMRFFNPALQSLINARSEMEDSLRRGLSRDEFFLLYQPQVEYGRVIGAEALIRWRHPERGMVSPVEFIPLAEESGLILSLGHWVLETACAQIAAWATRPETSGITLAVNVSARQFQHPDFVGEVLGALERAAADPRRLKLELTESMLVHNVEDVIVKMTTLMSHGLTFSLDDFGTGYSSLSYLKRLPLSQLKIDRSFVMDILTDPNDAAIARTIVALGRSLGLQVVAEGVESEEQRSFLAENGCNAYQGYLFSRPVPIEEFEALLDRGSPAGHS